MLFGALWAFCCVVFFNAWGGLFLVFWPREICKHWKQKQLRQVSGEKDTDTTQNTASLDTLDTWIEKVLEELQRVGPGPWAGWP